jgi:diketogulonate reductase-like aldo/keto reductase
MSGPSEPPGFELDRGLAGVATLADGQRMPVLGLGVWKSAPGAETTNAVVAALEAGYRLIDTAAMYRNEESVGEGIRRSRVRRDELFVTTKVWNNDQGYESTLRAFERSRKALGLDTVDLYLIHWPVEGLWPESWRALVELQRTGACRSIGVSNFGIAELEELRSLSSVLPVVDQVEFSPFVFPHDLLLHATAAKIQVEAYAPLSRGRRLDDPVVVGLAERLGRTPAQVLVRWALQHQVVAIPKSVRPERIRENAQVFDFQLGPSDMDRLDELNRSPAPTSGPTRST